MGLIKLALIGGAAYYAGKKLNEPHYDAQGNVVQDPRYGHHGGWCQRKKWHQQRQQEQQQSDPSQYPGQGMTRDMPYQDYPEKPSMNQQQQQPNDYQYIYHDYPQPQPQSRAYYHPEPTHDIKPRTTSPVPEKQMVKFETSEVQNTPPAYAGFNGRPLSPQQRMYGGNGIGMLDITGRSESTPPMNVPVQLQQAQAMYQQHQQRPQQMEFVEPKKPWSVDKLMWKS